MKQLTVRNVSTDLAKALREESRRRRKSINHTVIELLRQALGLTPEGRYDNGLSSLSASWEQEELEEFQKNTAFFETIDEEMWNP